MTNPCCICSTSLKSVITRLPPDKCGSYLCEDCTSILNGFRLRYALKNVRQTHDNHNGKSTGYHIADVKQQKC